MSTESNSTDINSMSFEEKFSFVTALQGVRDTKVSERPILDSELYNYVLGRHINDAVAIEQAISSSLPVRRRYMQIVENTRLAEGSKYAAAFSADSIDERVGDGFKISIVAANDDSGQMYLVLEITTADLKSDGDTATLHVVTDDRVSRTKFPEIHDRKAVCIVDNDDAVVQLLKDHDSQLSLV